MDNATIGLIGVVLGVFLTVAKEWLFQSRKNRKEVEYLCIQIACMLERFIGGCVEVVQDDGLFYGQYDSDECRSIQVSAPKFEPEMVKVEWKSLPAKIMYEILNFPSQVEAANSKISGAFEYVAGPPDYEEGFEERQYQYALLGIKASKLASRLRNYSRLPEREMDDWDPIHYMKEQIQKIESQRKVRAEAQSKMLADMQKRDVSSCDDV